MRKSNLAKNFVSAAGEPQQNLTPIFATAHSFQKAVYFKTIDEFHGAVVLDLKPFGKDPNGGVTRNGQSLDSEQSLILLRLDTSGTRGLLAQILETAHFVTKFRKRAVVEFLVSKVLQGSQ